VNLKRLSLAVAAAVTIAFVPRIAHADPPAAARAAEPVVLTGAQLPNWSQPAAQGLAKTWPSGATDGVRDAHNGQIVIPPAAHPGVDPKQITAYRWQGKHFVEVPVQVDQRFPYFLANGRSSFGIYSGTDEELTYQWDIESWKKTDGVCSAAYPPGASAMTDPVPMLDTDDEIAFMAGDAGPQAPADAAPPKHTTAGQRQQLEVVDPLDPTKPTYLYLFLRPSGSDFTASNGYVHYTRDANADQWIDKTSFAPGDPEALGLSNGDYGPNLTGTVCDAAGTPRHSDDRWPRDGVTVSTPTYQWYASGRWMVRQLHVSSPSGAFQYGPDLVDRWKGRAFQETPNYITSIGGFEDEQTNWEANSALLGERMGPVRAIRETWGADSGTNVTKTETFYRDAITYRYHLRVHPIPPNGLFTTWDHNKGAVTRYYNATKPDGVAIDGQNDDQGNIDALGGEPVYTDVADPTFGAPVSVLNWDEVSGNHGSLVYIAEVKGPTSAENPLVMPYYRDDACFDDGTGDDPTPRPHPGDAYDWGATPCDQRQGAWGATGLHYVFTNDTDNAFGPKPTTEIDAQQWQFPVPTAAAQDVGDRYGKTVQIPLQVVVTSG
jgi:hypothetical protein